MFSARGKCFACGDGRARANATQLHLHAGPHYQRWHTALVKALAAMMRDE